MFGNFNPFSQDSVISISSGLLFKMDTRRRQERQNLKSKPSSLSSYDIIKFVSSRSVANWFDEKGTISCDKFFVDVKNLYTEIGKSKKDN